MEINWIYCKNKSPKLHQYVLIRDDWGSYHFAIYEEDHNSECDDEIKCYVLLNGEVVNSQPLHYQSDFKKHYSYLLSVIEVESWIALDDFEIWKSTQPERLSEKTSKEDATV